MSVNSPRFHFLPSPVNESLLLLLLLPLLLPLTLSAELQCCQPQPALIFTWRGRVLMQTSSTCSRNIFHFVYSVLCAVCCVLCSMFYLLSSMFHVVCCMCSRGVPQRARTVSSLGSSFASFSVVTSSQFYPFLFTRTRRQCIYLYRGE